LPKAAFDLIAAYGISVLRRFLATSGSLDA
jgi:hypothetical protein